jgi:hypothetical protein
MREVEKCGGCLGEGAGAAGEGEPEEAVGGLEPCS